MDEWREIIIAAAVQLLLLLAALKKLVGKTDEVIDTYLKKEKEKSETHEGTRGQLRTLEENIHQRLCNIESLGQYQSNLELRNISEGVNKIAANIKKQTEHLKEEE